MTEISNPTPKQIRFCEEYLIDLNGKQAAIRAGYAPKTAEVQASRLLSYAKVQSYIKVIKSQITNKAIMTAEKVLIELSRIGSSDLKNLVNAYGGLKSLQDLPEDVSRVVSEIQTEHIGEASMDGNMFRTKIKFHPKTPALEHLAKYHGLFSKDNKQKGEGTGVVVILPSNSREKSNEGD